MVRNAPRQDESSYDQIFKETAADMVRLGPHEAPDTDIILLGHSMGGILSAEACLMAPYVAGTARSFRHRILGTINFDTPFLGMHPGVIASGLGSLFRPAADSPAPTPPTSSAMSQLQRPDSLDQASSASYFDQNESISPTLLPTDAPPSSTYSPLSPLSSLPSNDPNYNPSFPNDVNLPQRKGWSSVAHFINKHSDGLAAATKSYVTSHLEFGGALADYNALKVRYSQIRRLEDLNGPDRVRFVNYYTASTGRPKKPKDVRPESDRGEGTDSGLSPGMADIERPSKSPSPKISVQDTEGESRSVEADGIERLNLNEDSISDVNHMFSNQAQRVGCLGSAQTEDSIVGDSDTTIKPFEADAPLRAVSPSPSSVAESTISPSQTQTTLPPIPDLPPEPGPFTCEYEDKGMRRIAEQQHQREIKAYQRTVKDREKALKDRRKFHEKRERDVAKRREKETRKEEKERLKVEKDEAKRAAKDLSKTRKAPGYVSPRLGASLNPTLDAVTEDLKDKANKKPRDKKFCLLPSKVNGELDHCWVRVFMPGVDEVGAHCGLFVVDGERYEWFVCDVSQRISDWVRAA